MMCRGYRCALNSRRATWAASFLSLPQGNKHVGERFHMDRLRAAAKQVSAIMARAKAAAAAAPQTAAAGGSAGTQRGAAMTAVEVREVWRVAASSVPGTGSANKPPLTIPVRPSDRQPRHSRLPHPTLPLSAAQPPTGSPAKTLPRAIPADQRKLLIPGHA